MNIFGNQRKCDICGGNGLYGLGYQTKYFCTTCWLTKWQGGLDGSLAQRTEQGSSTPWATGSSPVRPSTLPGTVLTQGLKEVPPNPDWGFLK